MVKRAGRNLSSIKTTTSPHINNIDISEQEAMAYERVDDYLTGADKIYGMDQGENFMMDFGRAITTKAALSMTSFRMA